MRGARAGATKLAARVQKAEGPLRQWTVPATQPGKLRIEYDGTLPALKAELDHRGVLQRLPPMASPEGSFLSAWSAWYPAPEALFAYRVRLRLPAGQKGLVAGRLLAEEESGTLYRASFEFDAPADGIDLMAGPYRVQERPLPLADGKRVRLRTYFFAELEPLAAGYLEDSARYIELFSRRIGAYPFDQFSVVASPLPTGFGMPTLTYLGAEVIKLPFIRATSLGHEVLHNWWGNAVLIDYERGNWAEGLTTFMADYAFKERESADAARETRLTWLRDFAAIPQGGHLPLASFRSRTHGAAAAVGYGKAAMVFFMLRDALGEETFERGVRHFWETRRFKTASWQDLQAAFEHAAGRPLGAFFDQWLNRAGGPALRISEARGGKVTIEQSEPPYVLRVPLELQTARGAKTRVVEVSRARETVSVAASEPVTGVRLDPQLRLWRRLEPEELPPILRQWIIARAPRLIAVSAGPARQIALALATRFFEAPFQEVNPETLRQSGEPAFLVGLHEDVDRALQRLGLPPRPTLAQSGSALAWTIQSDPRATPVAVVSARDPDALRALLRPLPHYGSQSFVAFEGARMITRGVWPAASRAVPALP